MLLFISKKLHITYHTGLIVEVNLVVRLICVKDFVLTRIDFAKVCIVAPLSPPGCTDQVSLISNLHVDVFFKAFPDDPLLLIGAYLILIELFSES